MASTLSLRVAAAIALSPLALLGVAQPAAAQHEYRAPVVVPQAVQIERFVLRATVPLRPGRELQYRLEGVPGAQAWLDIPGQRNGIAMTEVRPGVYEARQLIGVRDNPSAFSQAVATLQRGGQRVSARVALEDEVADRGPRHGDRYAPRIVDLTPEPNTRVGARGWTHIGARLVDQGSGVDRRSIVLRIDGRDVSGRVRLEGDAIRYAEDLPRGTHSAELLVRDRAGNTARRVWNFEVGHERGWGWNQDRDTDGRWDRDAAPVAAQRW